MVPWDDVRDDGDTTETPHGYDSAAGLKQVLSWEAENYKRHRQEGQPRQIIVACEAAGMIPQLARVCHPYDVPVRSSGGMDSVTAKRRLGVEIAEARRPTLLLHVGDWDPTGLVIYAQLFYDVRQFMSDHMAREWSITAPASWLEVRRIAITQQQVQLYVDDALLGRAKKPKRKGWQRGRPFLVRRVERR
jgi:hypothetical protein